MSLFTGNHAFIAKLNRLAILTLEAQLQKPDLDELTRARYEAQIELFKAPPAAI